MSKKGCFFVFEGGEGSGKSTLSKRITEHFGDRAIWTREPGGTPPAEAIRNAVLTASEHPLDGLSSYLAISGGRRHHIKHVIGPAIEAGKIVVCDRFHASSFAYNCCAQQSPDVAECFSYINDMVTDPYWPTLELFLDLPIEVGLERCRGTGKALDRFDTSNFDFHERVRAGYQQYYHIFNPPHIVIDAQKSKDEVFAEALAAIGKYL